MASSLTAVGVVWALLSLVAAVTNCVAFYIPFWIQGRLVERHDAFFGAFRRCNFPRVDETGLVAVVEECGRYNSFWSIPTCWWQVSTVLVGVGCGLSLLVATTAVAACCIAYVLNAGSARLAGSLQLLSVLMIFTGAAFYPVGWYAEEVRDACGPQADVYRIGDCQVSWSAYLMAAGVGTQLVCVALSGCASKVKPGSVRL